MMFLSTGRVLGIPVPVSPENRSVASVTWRQYGGVPRLRKV